MTTKKFNPEQFKRNRLPSESEDPDVDLFALSVQVEMPNMGERERYIPAFPLRFLQQVVSVGDALPLLLVALAKMRMKGESEIALGPALWSMIGNPGPRVRSRLLKQIAGLPESLCTLKARTGRPHLLRTGPDWPVKIMKRRQG
jgi:hypothetical protein